MKNYYLSKLPLNYKNPNQYFNVAQHRFTNFMDEFVKSSKKNRKIILWTCILELYGGVELK